MLSRILVVSLSAFLFGAFPAYAQTATPVAPASSQVFATVNFQNATITTQKGNTFTIAFDISNRDGVQPDVRYGVALAHVGSGGVFSILDTHVYDEVLILGVNESVHRTITYTAPENFSGPYTLLLQSRNSSGIPFATVTAGTVTLPSKKDIVSIDPASCFLTDSGAVNAPHYPLTEKLSLNGSETLLAHCTVTNQTNGAITFAPQAVQRLRSSYGDIVSSGNSTIAATISLAPQTTKMVAVTVPLMTTPQTYSVAITLQNTLTAQDTNAIAFRYERTGAGASIQTLLLDKDAYSKGDTAVVSFIWSPFLDTVSNGMPTTSAPLSSPSAVFSITNGNNQPCGNSISQSLTSHDSLLKVSIPITADCQNPKVQATIQDPSHGTLDSQSFAVITPVVSSSLLVSVIRFLTHNPIAMAGIVLVALFLAVVLYKKRKPPLPIVMVLLALCFFGGAGRVHADSVVLTYLCQPSDSACPGASNIFLSGELDSSSYAPNQPMTFDVWGGKR